MSEEGSHSTQTKRPLDDSSLYSSPGKVIQSSGSDFHGSFEHDGRFAKIQRVEPRDDKRPSVPHRMPVGSTNFADHPISSDSRLESKQNKDARDNKAYDRETKADARMMYGKLMIGILRTRKERRMWMQGTGLSKEANIMIRNQMTMALKEIWRKIMKFLEESNAGGWCDRGEVVKHLSVNLDFGPECVMVKGLKGILASVHEEAKLWGLAGKSEVSAIVYKAGECMQELLKSWKEFDVTQDATNAESLQHGPTLEIRIPAEFVTSTNRQVKGAQLWGTDVYTNDSDLVAVLMHTGYCSPTSSPPPSAIQEHATIRVLPPQESYTSTLRNNVRSRAWGAGIGCSFQIERCCIVKKGGGTIDLEPRLSHTSAVEPTLAPVAVERTMTTRAAASNALRQQRFVREVTIQYNLCNEPWLKYSISIVADKGLKKSLYTSARLKKGEVIYLETQFNRYELCFSGEKPRIIGSSSNASE
ncbi:unnamed protein product [Miscanthus lutarioriparius]|uniref:Uncharacterized protein n=1 Tax=Miscanthus lutarioriparius TaxID=422564 RepID=A0A811R695_9POAL|nr:unnamed protein product [Miscanthus lutarioriparius]